MLRRTNLLNASSKLFAIKAAHTMVWTFFAGCIVAIPFAAYAREFRVAVLLIAAVMVEVLIIALNRGSCPLTPMAARYTADRADNFDIFLPIWLARYNKIIFGVMYVVALIYTLAMWVSDGRGA
jgi:uncharacterized membrane protein